MRDQAQRLAEVVAVFNVGQHAGRSAAPAQPPRLRLPHASHQHPPRPSAGSGSGCSGKRPQGSPAAKLAHSAPARHSACGGRAMMMEWELLNSRQAAVRG